MAGDTVITIIGNLTSDPELRFTPSGAAVANFFDRPRKALRSGKYWQVTRSSGVVDHLVRVVIESFTAAGVWRDASNVVDVRATKLTVGDEGALSASGARIVVRVMGSTS
jgi:hypothetical protein